MCWKHFLKFVLILFSMKTFNNWILLFLFIYPLDPTSNGIKLHIYPWSSIFCLSAVYFRVFLAFALSIFLSKLHVNSRTNTFLVSLLNSTKSGLDFISLKTGNNILKWHKGLYVWFWDALRCCKLHIITIPAQFEVQSQFRSIKFLRGWINYRSCSRQFLKTKCNWQPS